MTDTTTNHQDSQRKITVSSGRSSELAASLARRKDTAAKKRRDRKHGEIAAHYKLLLHKALSALGAPECAFDFVAGLIAVVGYNHADEVELFDEAFARATLGATHKMTEAEREVRVTREAARRRKQRQRILNWQAKATSPLLFEFDGKFNPATGKRAAKYQILITELVREMAAEVEPGATSLRVDRAASVRCAEYHERFTGEAKRLVTKQEQSPESDTHRAATTFKKAIDRVIKTKGIEAAKSLWMDEFLSRLPRDQYPFLYDLGNVKSQIEQLLTETTSGTTVTSPPVEIVCTHDMNSVLEMPERTLPVMTTPSMSGIGVSVDEFITATFGKSDKPKPKADNWRDQPPTPAQRDLLSRGDVFGQVITRGEASDRINELLASGALCDFLSLVELQQFDPKANGYARKERRFCCPLCGTDKPLDGPHRSLSVNTDSGDYFCHRCGARGKLREYLDAAPAIPARTFVQSAPTKVSTDDRWRKWVSEAVGITNTRGDAYMQSRTVPTDVAARAGVKFGTWWKANEQGTGPEAFDAVIFEIKSPNGKLVGAQARAIVGDTKRTKGEKVDGVFYATPGALDASRLAITEAPIDALVLAACGLDAIAICGDYVPEWLLPMLACKEVLPASDNDEAGERMASQMAKDLKGSAIIRRLRPAGGKDWAEVAKRHGLDSVAEQIEFALGVTNDETHDSALVA